MTILGPQGTPIHPQAPVREEGFVVSSDFSLQTGRGMVRITVPSGALMAKLEPYLGHLPSCEDVCTCGLANIKDAGELRFNLQPSEARQLGVRITTESETAIMAATIMRMLIDAFDVTPEKAVQVMGHFVQGTREDHREAYRQSVLRQQAQEAFEEDEDGTREPS